MSVLFAWLVKLSGELSVPLVTFLPTEGVIELFSHRDDRASRIVSAFVVGDSDDEAKAQGKETPALVRGRGLGRTHARGRSPSLIRWFA